MSAVVMDTARPPSGLAQLSEVHEAAYPFADYDYNIVPSKDPAAHSIHHIEKDKSMRRLATQRQQNDIYLCPGHDWSSTLSHNPVPISRPRLTRSLSAPQLSDRSFDEWSETAESGRNHVIRGTVSDKATPKDVDGT